MRYFDLHCDTLCAAYEKNVSFYGGGLHVDLNQAAAFGTYIQCCAAWIPDSYRGSAAYDYFKTLYKLFSGLPVCRSGKDLITAGKNGGIALIPTIEGGAVLGGSLARIDCLQQCGVKMLTLTWNADNEIGGGVGGTGTGLTPFGKQVVSKLEHCGILVDISHASPQLFHDVCACSTQPFVASHSNAKALCGHRRNLSDGQIQEIIRRRGLIGVNFYMPFLEDDPQKASIDSIVRHIDYYLSLGAEDVLAFGSDFDGADIPPDMTGVASVPAIYQRLLRHGYGETLLDKIFYRNAYSFFLKSYGISVPV